MTSANSTNSVAQPLTLPAQSLGDDVSAFDGDLLRRSVLARQIEQLIPRLRNGAVIAIDSQWGGGKTWFGINWAKSLRVGGHKVAFINAFEQDYTEDPFLPIAAELTALLDGDSKKALLKKRPKSQAPVCRWQLRLRQVPCRSGHLVKSISPMNTKRR